MIRRKLILVLGSLLGLLLVMAVSSMWLLQRAFSDFSDLNTRAAAGSARVAAMDTSLSDLESWATRTTVDDEARPEIRDLMLSLNAQIESLPDVLLADGEADPAFQGLVEQYRSVDQLVNGLADESDSEQAVVVAQRIQAGVFEMRRSIAELNQFTRARTEIEQVAITNKFRKVVLALAITFLVVINVSILVLFRVATIVLKPVERLVDASRRLAHEEFDHRVKLDQPDEFGELAEAYNYLAEQLQSNEQRKLEMLRQVARTLNHELNNAIAIIDLQLNLVARSSDGGEPMAKLLKDCHKTLARMSETVDALKRVRRIVLTDYVSGVKMLDLQRSVEVEPPARETASGTMTETSPS